MRQPFKNSRLNIKNYLLFVGTKTYSRNTIGKFVVNKKACVTKIILKTLPSIRVGIT